VVVAGALVQDLDHHHVVTGHPDAHDGRIGVGVTHNVGEGLLHDPERGDTDRARQSLQHPAVDVHLDADVQAGRGGALDDVAEPLQVGDGRAGGSVEVWRAGLIAARGGIGLIGLT
jgi:hypothetical protein